MFVPRMRSITAQLIACLPPNLLLLDLGMAINFVTIAVPELLNAKDGLSLNKHQASWFGSIPLLTQPLGALASGPLVDYIGRKKATSLVNIPHVVAWILMYYCWNLPSLFMANALLGLGSGLMEAPIVSYVSEISEPSIRGALTTVTQVFLSVGILLIYILGATLSWRLTAIICLCVPIITMFLASFVVPDTPVWLLSQGKEKDALKSLCYIRGWTAPGNVREEFDQLFEYVKCLSSCVICKKENKHCDDRRAENITESCEHDKMNIIKRFFIKFNIVMLCKETLRPLGFSLIYFAFFIMSGMNPIRPNMENVCRAMGMAQDAKTIVIMIGFISLLVNILVIIIIKHVGKRKIGITSMLGSAICCTGLSIYAHENLSSSVFSYDTKTFPKEKSYIPLVLLYGLNTFTSSNVVWILLGEIFPFRSRATSQGIAAAWSYVVAFIGAKTLIDLEINFQLEGAFAVYATFGYLGALFLYLFLPETEGKSLQDIEIFYQGKFRIFADDWFINKLKKRSSKTRM